MQRQALFAQWELFWILLEEDRQQQFYQPQTDFNVELPKQFSTSLFHWKEWFVNPCVLNPINNGMPAPHESFVPKISFLSMEGVSD